MRGTPHETPVRLAMRILLLLMWDAVAAEGAFFQLDSGSCPAGQAITVDNLGSEAAALAKCDEAATALGLSVATSQATTYTYNRPPGCSWWPNSELLYVHTSAFATEACDADINCLCMAGPPAPPAAPPAPPMHPGAVAQTGSYYLITSGTCGEAAMITGQAECGQAAAALELSDTSASTSTYTFYPPGCVFRSSSLYLHPSTNSYSCRSSEQCLCALRPPSPPTSPPAPPSPPAPLFSFRWHHMLLSSSARGSYP